MLRWGLVALAGGVVCTVLDHLHAVSGVLAYPHVFAWAQAWWVPFLFAGAALVLTSTVRLARGWFGAPLGPRPGLAEVVAGAIGFVTAYAYTSFGWHEPNVVLAVLVGFFLARALGQPRWVVVLALCTAVSGTLFEAGWSALGFFYYQHPDVLGVPRWLPGIYLHVGLLMPVVERLVRAPARRSPAEAGARSEAAPPIETRTELPA